MGRSLGSADTPVVPRWCDWTGQRRRFSDFSMPFCHRPVPVTGKWTDGLSRIRPYAPTARPTTLGDGHCKFVKWAPDPATMLHCKIHLTFLCNAIYPRYPGETAGDGCGKITQQT